MIRQLRHARSVQPCHEDVGIHVSECPADNGAAADEQHPLPVRGDDGRGETALRVGDDAFLCSRLVVDFPYLALACRVEAGAYVGRLLLQRIGVHAVGEGGKEVVFHVVAPNAHVLHLHPCEEYLLHVGRIDGRIVLVAVRDLAAHIPVLGIRAEDLVRVSARFREADVFPVGRIGEVQYRRAVRPLNGTALFRQVFDENVGGVVARRQVSQVLPIHGNVQDTVRQPVDAVALAVDNRQAHTVGIRCDLYELVAGLLRHCNNGVIYLLRMEAGCRSNAGKHRCCYKLFYSFYHPLMI